MSSETKKIIYLDHHATTPVDSRVLEHMLPYFTEVYGNASSTDHTYGLDAKRAVDEARQQVAKAINADASEIIFTSGATESNNLALIGAAKQYAKKGKHIISCVTEHKAVLDTCKWLESDGYDVTYLPVDNFGMIDLDELLEAIRPDTVLISLMAANNEIGVLHPLKEIGAIAQEHDVLFHTDATQAIGLVPIDVVDMNIDLLSLSGHKIYGPKGIGALYVRKRSPRVRLAEQIHGGGHERGMRSGTLNVPGIVGLGKAAELAVKEMPKEAPRLKELRDLLWQGLQENIEGVELNGHPTERLSNNLNIAIPGVENRAMLVHLNEHIALSTGSACTTAVVEPSHVIMALGYGEERAYCSLRFGLGRNNFQSNLNTAVHRLKIVVKNIKQFNPI